MTRRAGGAKVVTFMAGKDRGGVFLPEVGDEVLVAFEHGGHQPPLCPGRALEFARYAAGDERGRQEQHPQVQVAERARDHF